MIIGDDPFQYPDGAVTSLTRCNNSSMDRRVISPLEHGELESSPNYSPEIAVEIMDDSHMSGIDSDNSLRLEDQEDLGPDIKPPQAKIKKDKYKHRYKHEKRKNRPNVQSDRHRERSDKGANQSGRSQVHRVVSLITAPPKDHGGDHRNIRKGDSEQLQRERKPRQGYVNYEEDVLRREKSIKERERLEKLEMERRRLDREISRREQEQWEKVQRERERDRLERAEYSRKLAADDARRVLTRKNLETRRDRGKVQSQRSRSPHLRKADIVTTDRKQRSEPKSAGRYRSSQQLQSEQEEKRRIELPSKQRPTTSMLKDEISKTQSKVVIQKKEETSLSTESESSADSESGSNEDDSDDDSDSDTGSSSEQEENPDVKTDTKDTDHFKSRFDSEPESEQDVEQASKSEHTDNDQDSGLHSDQGYNDYLDETPPQSPTILLPDLPLYFPAIQGCRNVEDFNCLNRIEEGTFGVVYRARDKKTDEIVALKRLKMEKEKEGFPITSLREINTLLKSQHPNIVTVREIVVGSNMDRIYIVMDYVEHDIKGLMEYGMTEPFIIGEVKTLLIQLLRGVAHLHDNWIIHRDLKTSNLLLSHAGILKIGDFGLAREYGSPLKPYTPIVVTLWYRAPELLLCTKEYSCPIDLWSVGCIMAEFLTKKPLFPGKSEIDELNKIFKELGTPNEKIWPGVSNLKGWKTCTFADYPYNQLRNRFGAIISEKGFELLNRFLTYDPAKRITAEEGLRHEWFKETPAPVDPSMFPTWPAKSEQPPHKKSGNSPRPPSGGKAYSNLLDDDTGFRLAGVPKAGGGFALKF